MLVLTRRRGESIRIGDDVIITLVSAWDGKARIGIDAPKDVPIVRHELGKFTKPMPAAPHVPGRTLPNSMPPSSPDQQRGSSGTNQSATGFGDYKPPYRP